MLRFSLFCDSCDHQFGEVKRRGICKVISKMPRIERIRNAPPSPPNFYGEDSGDARHLSNEVSAPRFRAGKSVEHHHRKLSMTRHQNLDSYPHPQQLCTQMPGSLSLGDSAYSTIIFFAHCGHRRSDSLTEPNRSLTLRATALRRASRSSSVSGMCGQPFSFFSAMLFQSEHQWAVSPRHCLGRSRLPTCHLWLCGICARHARRQKRRNPGSPRPLW